MFGYFVRIGDWSKIDVEGGERMDAQQQEAEARKLEAKAESERQQATRFEQNSEAHAKIGDDTRAEVERKQAEQLAKEAEELDAKAQALHSDASFHLGEANRIQREIDRVRSEADSKIDALEREKKKHVGASVLL